MINLLRHCKYHCAVCDLHFTSLAGFDAHKPGLCRDKPKDSRGVEYVQVEGVCDLTKGSIGKSLPVMIWRNNSEKPVETIKGRSGGITLLSPEDAPTVECKPLELILCAICNLPVPRSGKRGRPRKIHEACR